MNKSIITLLALLLLVSIGCRPYELEQRGRLLESGMTKTQVKAMFAAFPLRRETNMVGAVQFKTKQFSTNSEFSSLILYFPKGLTDDSLRVLFDTNDIFVAYNYQLMK